jgi:hypothetical protein
MSFPPASRKKRLAINVVASFLSNTKALSNRNRMNIAKKETPLQENASSHPRERGVPLLCWLHRPEKAGFPLSRE